MAEWRIWAKFVGSVTECLGTKDNIAVGDRGLLRGSCNAGFVLCKHMGVWYCA